MRLSRPVYIFKLEHFVTVKYTKNDQQLMGENMRNIKQLSARLTTGLLVLAIAAISTVAPVNAATVALKPTLAIKYVGNCLNPTVEITISNLSGAKDIYFQGDSSIVLIAKNYSFDAKTIYDGFYSFGSVQQVDVYVTNAGSGPYAKQVINRSTAATALCPTYYPDYDAHFVSPTTPVGSVNVDYQYLEWFRNKN